MIRFNYRHRRAYNNTDGAFSVLAERLARRSVGAGRRRHASSHARLGVDAGAAQPQRASELGRQQRRAVHDHDRHRRQRRFDLQRSAAADCRATACGCRGDRRSRRTCRTRFRSASRQAPKAAGPAPADGRRRRARRPARPSEGHHDQRVGAEPDQSIELLGLQRRDDVAVLPAGDERLESAPGRPLAPLHFRAFG